MASGKLREFFTGVYAKYLSAVEADPGSSNQHEIGSNKMADFLGRPEGKAKRFSGQLVYLPEDDEEPLFSVANLSWYDSRYRQSHRGPEYRLYYDNNPVTERMTAGDFAVIAGRTDGSVLIVITPPGSSAEKQLRYLFKLGEDNRTDGQFFKKISELERVSFVEKFILDILGIEAEGEEKDLLDSMIYEFGETFPPTREFSEFARKQLPHVNPEIDDPDEVFVEWFEKETSLFKTFEDHIVSRKLEEGFKNVDEFVSFSLSVQNRRKSRAGYAAENHLETLFSAKGIQFSRSQKTEGRSRPDFIFPSINHYRNPGFPEKLLTMLGVKTTCKDRWRQVLVEAKRIEDKKLFTLEPAISTFQTDEMKAHNLQLVVPSEIRETFNKRQKAEVLSLAEFVRNVKKKQGDSKIQKTH